MNRLNGSFVYLVGPIDYAHDKGVGWRKDISTQLSSRGIIVLDPTNKPTKEINEDESTFALRKSLRDKEDYDGLASFGKNIRAYDLRCVDKADFLVAYLNFEIRMCGTWNEIFIADQQRKPVLIFCKQGKREIPDWMYWTFPHQFFFDDVDSLMEYIHEVDTSVNKPESYSRWKFFNYNIRSVQNG